MYQPSSKRLNTKRRHIFFCLQISYHNIHLFGLFEFPNMAVFFFLISLTEVLLLYFLLIPVVILHSMIIVKTSDLTSLDPGFFFFKFTMITTIYYLTLTGLADHSVHQLETLKLAYIIRIKKIQDNDDSNC